jgi:hypothetical protein
MALMVSEDGERSLMSTGEFEGQQRACRIRVSEGTCAGIARTPSEDVPEGTRGVRLTL